MPLLYAFVAYWTGVGLLWMRRRRGGHTKVDLNLIRWGFLILLPISTLVARYVWRLKGFVP